MTNTTAQTTVQFDANWETILECAAIEVFQHMAGVRLELNEGPGAPHMETIPPSPAAHFRTR